MLWKTNRGSIPSISQTATSKERLGDIMPSWPRNNDTIFRHIWKRVLRGQPLPTICESINPPSAGELRRNRSQRGYRPKQAEEMVVLRQHEKSKPRIGDWEGHRVKPPKWLGRRIGDTIIGNGRIRQYLAKSKRLDNVTQKELEHITHRLKHRPRKPPGFKTPYELFSKKKIILTVPLGSWIRQGE